MGEGGEEVPLPAPSGLRLAEARVRAGWSLLQAADQLHLDIVSVQALEAGDFAVLGAMVYARGHLRRYAELLGLPEVEIAAACARARFPDRDPQLKRGATGLRRHSGRGLRLPAASAAVAATLLVLIALVWWAMRMPHVARSPAAGTAAAASFVAPPGPQSASAASEPDPIEPQGPGFSASSQAPLEIEQRPAAKAPPHSHTASAPSP